MKKILMLLLVMSISLSVVGCGTSSKQQDKETKTEDMINENSSDGEVSEEKVDTASATIGQKMLSRRLNLI